MKAIYRRAFPGLVLAIGAIGIGLSACGGGDDRARGVINGQKFELGIQNVDCVAGPPTPNGEYAAPLLVTINFETSGFFSDMLAIIVSDIRPIEQRLDAMHPMQNDLIHADLTLNAQDVPIYAGLIHFDSISNRSGNKVCADWQLDGGQGNYLEGEFCCRVRIGL